MSADTNKDCDECGRPARWWWPGNNYERSRFLCGYHKRAYVSLWVKE